MASASWGNTTIDLGTDTAQVILHHLKRSCVLTQSPCQAVLLAFPEGTAAHGVNCTSSGTDLFKLCIIQHGLVIPTFAIITSAK